jgi:type VI secretion system protein VasD
VPARGPPTVTDRKGERMYRWVGASVASLALVLGACASKPPKPEPTKAVIGASGDVNPDADGRPSPIVVRIYQLRGDAEFNGAEFFALWDMEKATLAANLVMRDERTLFPGQQQQLELALAPDTRFVGVAAAFRDVRAARWRASFGGGDKPLLQVLAKRKVSVQVGKDAVTVEAAK